MNRRNGLERAVRGISMEDMAAPPPIYQDDWSDPSLLPPPTYQEAVKKIGGASPEPEVEASLSEIETNIDEEDGVPSSTSGNERSREDTELNREEMMSQRRLRRRMRRERDQIGGDEAEELEMMDCGLESGEDQSSRNQHSDEEAEEETPLDAEREGYNGDEHTTELGSTGRSQSRGSIDYECGTFPILTPVVSYVMKTWNRASKTKKILICGGVFIFLGLLLFVSLFPASFVYIEYDQMGFSRNKVTGAHDYSEVYQSGCYLLAPQDEIVSFPATAHFLELELSVMNSGGLSIGLTVYLQYFLKPEELHHLFQKYHFGYPDVIRSVAESSVKNTATEFDMEQYRLNRSFVEAQIFKQLRLTLSGDCCASCCPSCASNKIKCGPNDCKVDKCSSGFHVDVRYFQLGDVSIPQQVLNQYMKQVKMKIQAEKEYHLQAATLERIRTELNVQSELNGANELRKMAEADQHLIKARAAAASDRDVQTSYLKSLKKFFSHMNISSEDKQISFIYMKSLKDVSHNLYAFSYNYEKTVKAP